MPKKIYISIINNSDADRTDIVYAGNDLTKAQDMLWNMYKIFIKEYETEDDYKPYANKYMFLNDAMSKVSSAYIQYRDFYVNFELHTCKPNGKEEY